MTTATGRPLGYYEKCLAIDSETTGINFNGLDPSTGYQAIAWGIIVVDVATWSPIEEMYVEVKWDGKSYWSSEAEQVHGLSKAYLKEHGMDEVDAVTKIGNLLVKHWGPQGNIRLLGHNVTSFDRPFLFNMFARHGVFLKLGNRHIDTSSIGIATFGTFNSNELFSAIGLDDRDKTHNALVDAHYSLEAVRVVSELFKKVVLGE